MNAGRHYDDETLIAIMDAKGEPSDAHLSGCETCTEKLESVRMIAEALKDETVWSESSLPVPSTIASLRAAAARMEDEDAQAGIDVRELLTGSRDSWRGNLDAHPEYRTAGVVRKLIAAASRAVDTMPPDAVEIAAIATTIAESLDRFDGRAAALCGAALREYAYALYYTGRFSDALVEADRADAHFAKCTIGEFDQARVGIVRALALRALERWKDALHDARNSVRTFEEFGDLDRVASARLAEAHLLFSLRDFDQAVSILSDQETVLRALDHHTHTYAMVLMNLAYAYWQQAKTADALRYYDASSAILTSIGVETEALRIRWSVATMLADAGHRDEALRRLRDIAAEFEHRGMTCEGALAGLGIVELLLAEGKFAEIEEICLRAMRAFEAAGVSYTAKALTALAYMRESSRERTATPKLVRHVRDYIRRLPADENLLFAPI